MGEVLAIVVMVVFVGSCLTIGFLLWRRTFMQVEVQWQQVVADLNWDIMISPSGLRWLKRQYPAMKGSLNGMQVACIMSPTGSGLSMAKTIITVALENPTNYEMTLHNVDQKIKSNNFVERFKVESEQEALGQQLFALPVQQLLLDSGAVLTDRLVLEGNELTYETTVQVKTDKLREDFVELLELMTKLANYIQDLRID